MIGGCIWATAVFLVVVVVGGTPLLLRWLDDRKLVHLSLLACLVALTFAPLLRALPEAVSLPFFVIGLWPSLGVIAISVAASLIRAIQARSRRVALSLVLGALAAGLFYINAATPWIWPYRTY